MSLILLLFLTGERHLLWSQNAAFSVTSPLVLVDVIAVDKKAGGALKQLTRDDLRLSDNGNPVPISTFEFSLRPVTLWFIMICDQIGWADQGSTFFAGQSKKLSPALARLNPLDQVAVAHWCDDGASSIDLNPTSTWDSFRKHWTQSGIG